jgi:hypothetical protein
MTPPPGPTGRGGGPGRPPLAAAAAAAAAADAGSQAVRSRALHSSLKVIVSQNAGFSVMGT